MSIPFYIEPNKVSPMKSSDTRFYADCHFLGIDVYIECYHYEEDRPKTWKEISKEYYDILKVREETGDQDYHTEQYVKDKRHLKHVKLKVIYPDCPKTKGIPEGDYCYLIERIDKETGKQYVRRCPHWGKSLQAPEQMFGYCSWMEMGDWESNGTSLLWDGCKECGQNITEEID